MEAKNRRAKLTYSTKKLKFAGMAAGFCSIWRFLNFWNFFCKTYVLSKKFVLKYMCKFSIGCAERREK